MAQCAGCPGNGAVACALCGARGMPTRRRQHDEKADAASDGHRPAILQPGTDGSGFRERVGQCHTGEGSRTRSWNRKARGMGRYSSVTAPCLRTNAVRCAGYSRQSKSPLEQVRASIPAYQTGLYRIIYGVPAWVVYMTMQVGHWRMGWRGCPAIHRTAGGFMRLLVAYFGNKLALEILLKRG